ncbi:helix-turn-helix transcriptional regulator, partial [Mediterraneibacter glycyrrhizinilyticus]|nr:helix-turn-helix transcriptional regulator [Mediterraneibacter glycyrrhizinilyticus]
MDNYNTKYIEQNFQNDISVENIASFCGLNRTYFGRIFKETAVSYN